MKWNPGSLCVSSNLDSQTGPNMSIPDFYIIKSVSTRIPLLSSATAVRIPWSKEGKQGKTYLMLSRRLESGLSAEEVRTILCNVIMRKTRLSC